MKRIAYILLIVAAMIAPASAYILTYEVPSTIQKGEDIYIEGSSSLLAGTTMQLALYRQTGTIDEIDRNSFTIQDEGYWSTLFETADLAAGKYKIEVPKEYKTDLGSSSTFYQMFEIVDRSSELKITSSNVQKFSGELWIAGRSMTRGNAGIELLVEGPYGIVFPRQWISTDSSGNFDQMVTIETSGDYNTFFYDNNGLIAEVDFEVTPSVLTVEETASPTATVSAGVMQAQTFASAEAPAYFSIDTDPGIVDIYTSSGKNWVISYIGEDMVQFTVDKHNDNSAEKVTIPVEGGMVYVKVYPAEESESGYVTLYAEGASSIAASKAAEGYFTDSGNSETPQTGLGIAISLLSVFIALFIAGIAVKRQ